MKRTISVALRRLLPGALLLLAVSAPAAFDFKKFKIDPNKKKFSNKQPIATAGVRGLDEPGSEGDVDARDPESLAWLEEQKVADSALASFAADGKLEKLP